MNHSMFYDVTMTTLIVVCLAGMIWGSWKMNKESKALTKRDLTPLQEAIEELRQAVEKLARTVK